MMLLEYVFFKKAGKNRYFLKNSLSLFLALCSFIKNSRVVKVGILEISNFECSISIFLFF
jgi:hypothetical protein